MHKTLRPYVTTGMAVAGAALIAVIPAAPLLPVDQQQVPQVHQVQQAQQRPVALTAGPGDIFTPYADLITYTANNLAGLGSHLFDFPVLSQFFSDPIGSLNHVPDALITLNTLLPSIDVTSTGLPIQIGAEMTPPLSMLLSTIGPLVTFGNAVGEIGSQVFSGDLIAALTALIDSPATLLNALLNGQDNLDVAGFSIPAFNGLLAPGRDFETNFTVGQLVDLAGFGKTTVGDLVDQTGIGDQSLASLAISLLGFAGVNNPTITDLADQAGLSNQSLSDVLIQLLGLAGIDNPTITDIADQAGLSGQSLGALLNQVLGFVGLDNQQSMTTLVLTLLNGAGMGNDPTLGDLAVTVLNALGMGNTSIADLVEQIIPGTTTLGDLAKQAIAAVAPGDPTITELLVGLGMGNLTIGNLVTPLLDMLGVGQQTPLDLFNSMFNPGGGVGPTLGELIVNIMQSGGLDYTLGGALTQIPDPYDPNQTMADVTVGTLLNNTEAPYHPGMMIGDTAWTEFLASDFAQNMGTKTIADLAAQAGQPLDPTTCALAVVMNIYCNDTLNDLMGPRTVYQTLLNLKSDGHGIAALPAGTPLTSYTLADIVNGTGQADLHLSSVVLGLNMNNPVTQILTDLGLNNVTVDNIVTNGFPWLMNTTVVSLLSSWGLNNLDINTVIDRLGLDMTLSTMLHNLGLDNITLTTVVEDLLGGVHISTILNDLGLDNVTLETFLNNLLGGVYVGDLLNDLGLNDIHINDLITGLLSGTTVGDILDDLGLNNVHLNDVIDSLLGNVTLGTIIDDLGISNATVDTLLASLGLNDVDVLGVTVGDFAGSLWTQIVDIPQQIAAALAG